MTAGHDGGKEEYTLKRLPTTGRKKLALNRETLRVLTNTNLAQVIGGAMKSQDAGARTDTCRTWSCNCNAR